jgi:uncharacterized damage-inducible protein DinB
MPSKEEIGRLFEYNRWANARVLSSTRSLTAEEFRKDLGNSFPSVRDTLAHILGAEWIWLMRWKGSSPPALLGAELFPTLRDLEKRWAAVEREQRDFVARASPSDLSRVISYVNTRGETWSYPLGIMMQHVVNHSSYHRGQTTTMLRQLGRIPAATDLLLFFDETPEGT